MLVYFSIGRGQQMVIYNSPNRRLTAEAGVAGISSYHPAARVNATI
jgi:hypothetical protein